MMRDLNDSRRSASIARRVSRHFETENRVVIVRMLRTELHMISIARLFRKAEKTLTYRVMAVDSYTSGKGVCGECGE